MFGKKAPNTKKGSMFGPGLVFLIPAPITGMPASFLSISS
jgi:hypothetical protein